MRLSKDDTICGVRAAELRALFRYSRQWHGIIDIQIIANRLGVDRKIAADILNRLLSEGFVQVRDPHKSGIQAPYELNDEKAGSIVKASFAKPISRKTADRLVADLRERAHAINNDREFLYYVDYVCLFGSYVATDKPAIGDVDVAVSVSERYRRDAERDRAYAHAHGFRGDFVSEMFWPREHVLLTLKNRSRALSLTELDDAAFVRAVERGEARILYCRPGAPALEDAIRNLIVSNDPEFWRLRQAASTQ